MAALDGFVHGLVGAEIVGGDDQTGHGGLLMEYSSPSPSGEGLGWGLSSPPRLVSVRCGRPTPTPPLKGRGLGCASVIRETRPLRP
jgi:hypothetical protein